MTNKKPQFHSLSRRIVVQFCLFTLVISAVFSVLAFLLMYNLEDSFIERDVKTEAGKLIAHYQENKQWPAVSNEIYSLHFTKETFPQDFRAKAIEEPHRKEFYGTQGRHYHIYPLPNFGSTYLVAEVSQLLLVRPVREGIFKLLFISTGILTLIAFLMAWLLGRKTAKPLKELADLVDGVEPAQIPASFADKFPHNEIGILARTLEQTMGQICAALERERYFTRDVSHELRTPVTIIKNAIEVYRQKHGNDNNELITRIYEAAVQMEQTVTTLLHLAREEHAAANKTSVNLMPLIEQSIIERSYLLEGKDIEVDVEENCDVKIQVQQGMLKVLLDNLISNAFQYTNQGMVSVYFNNKTLTIADTGSGIEPEISQQVTQPAIKGNQSTGYGFGLSIVKRLCEIQRWQLTVKSENNNGTQISVTFE